MTRRVVTGTGDDGRSRIISDRDVPPRVLWYGLHGSYSDLLDPDASLEERYDIGGPDSGYIFMSIELPPDSVTMPLYEAGVPGVDSKGFHQTRTVDMITVVEGELVSEQEDGEVVLRPGDCLIQRGTNHAWRNRGDKPVKFTAVLINDRER